MVPFSEDTWTDAAETVGEWSGSDPGGGRGLDQGSACKSVQAGCSVRNQNAESSPPLVLA